MKFLREKGIAIIACADTKLIRRSGRTAMSLAGEVLTQVLERAGFGKQDIDGLAMSVALSEACNPFWTNLVAEALGLSLSWTRVLNAGPSVALGQKMRLVWEPGGEGPRPYAFEPAS